MNNINRFIHQFKIMLIRLDSLFFTYKVKKRQIIYSKQKELDYKETFFELLFNKQKKRKKIQEDIIKLNNEISMYDSYYFKFRKTASKYIFEYIEKYINDYILTDDEYKKSFQCLYSIYKKLTREEKININELKKSSDIFLKYIENVSKPKRNFAFHTEAPPNVLNIKYDSIGEKYTWIKDILDNIYNLESSVNYGLQKNIIPILLPSTNENELIIQNLNYKSSNTQHNVSDRHHNYISYCGLSLDDDVNIYENYYNMIPLIFKDVSKLFEGIDESFIFSNVNVHSLFEYYYRKEKNEKLDWFEFLDIKKKEKKAKIKNTDTNEWTALSVINSRNVGYRCSCCGKLYIKDNKTCTLNAHEMWKMELDKEEKTFQKKLKKIISLCNDCHMVFHGCNWKNENDRKNVINQEYEYVKKIISSPNIINKNGIDEKEYQVEIDARIIRHEDCLKNSIYLNEFKKIIAIKGKEYNPQVIEEYSYGMKM